MQQVMAAIHGGPSEITRIVGLSRSCAVVQGIGVLHQHLSSKQVNPGAQHVGLLRQQGGFVRVGRIEGPSTWYKFSRRPSHWKGLAAAAFGLQIFSLQSARAESAEQDGSATRKHEDLKAPAERVGEDRGPEHAKAAEALSKPESCTADELHFVAVPGTEWRLALWRYRPADRAPIRNHPVLMLSGIGTNALGFDLAPDVSLARYLSSAGFDTWVLEVRGAGLGKREGQASIKDLSHENGAAMEVAKSQAGLVTSASILGNYVSAEELSPPQKVETKKVEAPEEASLDGKSGEADNKLPDTIWAVLERLRGLMNEGQSRFLSAKFVDQLFGVLNEYSITGRITEYQKRLSDLLEEAQNSTIGSQLADTRNRFIKLLEESQLSVSPRVSDLQERMSALVDEYQKILDLIGTFDWDFDHYLEEDVPAAMEYILKVSNSVDGKVFGIGHSMGGILLYALLATRGEQSRLAAVVTVASALDYGVSDSSLKLLLPLADPSRLLNVPVVPLGALMTAVHPLVTRPPFALAWLGQQVSANGSMDPDLFSKLVLNNFGTIPVKLLLHLATVFEPGGLRNRDGTIFYMERIADNRVPVLALAGDRDLICPPSAVLDTANKMPKDVVTVKRFGGNGTLYGHYDLLVGRQAKKDVYPLILEFLLKHENAESARGQRRDEQEVASESA